MVWRSALDMGFWDDQLIKQLEGFLRKQRRALEVWRMPNEYGRNASIMLIIRVLGDTYLDVAEWNHRWNAALIVDTGPAIEPALIEKAIASGMRAKATTRPARTSRVNSFGDVMACQTVGSMR